MAKKPKDKPADPHAAAGHNSDAVAAERRRVLLRETHAIRQEQAKIGVLKAQMEGPKAEIKDARSRLKNAGFTLRLVDEAAREIMGSRIDSAAQEVERAEIRDVFGLPTGADADKVFAGNADSIADPEAAGYTAGITGADPTIPKQYDGTDGQLWLQGWHAGQKVLGDAMVASMDAKNAAEKRNAKPDLKVVKADPKPASDVVEVPAETFSWGSVVGDAVQLNQSAFPPHMGTDTPSLEEVGKEWLAEVVIPYWEAATYVWAAWGGQRRVLKEPGYEDLGTEDSEPSEVVADEPDATFG